MRILNWVAVGLIIYVGVSAYMLAEKTAREEADNPTCRSNWRLCRDANDLADHYHDWIKATAMCKIALTRTVKFGEPQLPRLSFYYNPVGNDFIKTGIIIAVERDAKLQNMYGAMEKATVLCYYDLGKNKVVDLSRF